MKKYLIKILSCIMSGILFIAAFATLTIANDSESCAQGGTSIKKLLRMLIPLFIHMLMSLFRIVHRL